MTGCAWREEGRDSLPGDGKRGEDSVDEGVSMRRTPGGCDIVMGCLSARGEGEPHYEPSKKKKQKKKTEKQRDE